jgi:serine/threonine-protein phosphatase 6 regulatory subunit 3
VFSLHKTFNLDLDCRLQDAFGPFADTHAASGDDPFTFSTSFSDEMEDSSFDSSSFGEFGEFQSAQDGELTPTTGSWTFAGTSDEAGSDYGEIGSPREEKRMIGGGGL